ncbi:hypothetical protein [Domibacillus sp. 8LH]
MKAFQEVSAAKGYYRTNEACGA